MTTVYQRFIAEMDAEPLTTDERLALARHIQQIDGVADGRYQLLRDWAQRELAAAETGGDGA